jgi:hypothetical protein
MFSRLLSHKAAVGAVLVTSVVLAASLVGPAMGAPSPLSVAKKALRTAKKANKTAKKANKTAKGANTRSKSAKSAATAAGTTATGATHTAGTALTKAGQALSLAQFASQHSGPAAIGFGNDPDVPNDGSSVSDDALCPGGYLPVGGGVLVLDSSFEPVTSGVSITQSSINMDGTGWSGAVQDVDNASDRILDVTVQCSKPAAITTNGRDRYHRHHR